VGFFTITVPKDSDPKLTWTLRANGTTTIIPANLDPLWLLAPLKDATGNTPPFIAFTEEGPFTQGPTGQSTSRITALQDRLTLTVWLADDAVVAPGGRTAQDATCYGLLE
jgi:hypothetical protein